MAGDDKVHLCLVAFLDLNCVEHKVMIKYEFYVMQRRNGDRRQIHFPVAARRHFDKGSEKMEDAGNQDKLSDGTRF